MFTLGVPEPLQPCTESPETRLVAQQSPDGVGVSGRAWVDASMSIAPLPNNSELGVGTYQHSTRERALRSAGPCLRDLDPFGSLLWGSIA